MSANLRAERPRIRKPRGEGALRRSEILAAAKRLFLEEGFERATMRRIAAVVGVSGAALYVYFPDKEAILHAIAEETFGELQARLEASEQASEQAGQPPLERMRAGLLAYVAFGRERPDEYRLTFLSKIMGRPAPGPACSDMEAADRSFAILERGVAELMETGVFEQRPTVLVAETLWATVHGVTAVLLDHAEHLESDPDVLAASVIDTALRGLARTGDHGSSIIIVN